ncbi:MAG: hypothetical protein ACLFS9_11895 [Nitriliruptoraceae bacterium]
MKRPADGELPLYVPSEFEVEHLDEARRTVIRSHLPKGRPRWVTPRASGRPVDRYLVILLHLTAAVLTLAVSAMTGTWREGLALLLGVAVSLSVTLLVLHRISRRRRREPDG